MINSITFIENYELSLEKEEQKRWGVKTYQPTRYSREKKPWKMFSLFKKGLHIDFNEGVNVIVGENGSGKTTLFSLIKEYTGKGYKKMHSIIGTYEGKDEEYYFQNYQKEYKGVLQVNGVIHYRNAVYFSAEEDNPVVAIPKMANPMNKNFNNMLAELFFAQEESHGESMQPILEYLLQNARGSVLFFDEPETALSLKNQIWLGKEMIRSAKENNNQIIISTHALALINQFHMVFDMEAREWVDRETYVMDIMK
jgi:predicted ATPase